MAVEKQVRVDARTIFGLALPALGVLAATPLYLLLDTAVVGRLGATDLAALGAATTIQAQVTTQLTFLSYGTTARSARLFGAGKQAEAIAEGVQATWVAFAVGLLLAVTVWLSAPVLALWLSGQSTVAAEAALWLRVASLGIPLILATMAGNGWLRGLHNTRLPLLFTLAGVIPSAILVPILVHRFGIVGSAWANLIGETITFLGFFLALVRAHRGSWRPDLAVIKRQLGLGKDLIARSALMQVSFVSAAAVAGRFGEVSLAAHQIMLQLWSFLTLVLDSLAIAAQALIGSALGASSVAMARRVGVKVVQYSMLLAGGLALALLLGRTVIPALFTTDPHVRETINGPWWLMCAMVLIGGLVFAFDGVLLGASDAAFLRNATMLAAVAGFLPLVWLSLAFGWGLLGVWCGLMSFLVLRAIAVLLRFQSMKWATI
ncbi:MATE family efflux transporter [Corynebacterium hindlerae]|uniref:MATE family efflux transporter n=1 Tax=Corynebacterium hindlerae TaxID=699041 RepID=UPI0031B68CF9